MKKLIKLSLALLALLVSEIGFAQTNPTNPQTICEGFVGNYQVDQAENLGAGTTGSTYSWSVITPGFLGSITNNPLGSVPPASTNRVEINWGATPPGAYILQVFETSADGCVGAPVTIIVQLEAFPIAAITPPTTNVLNCTTTSINLTATGGGSYSWSDGTSNVGNTANISVNAPGTYTVTVTSANGCTDTESIIITQDATPPVAAITPPATNVLNCTTTSISVTASGGGTYSWDNGLGSNATATITVAGTYTVTVTAANGCTDTESIIITQDATPPVAAITNNTGTTVLVCNGTISLTATGGDTYSWSGSLGNNAAATVTVSGTYTVTVTATNGCTSTASITITDAPLINPTFNSVAAICQNSPAPPLPNSSIEGITGTWSPLIIDTSVSGPVSYTFTPNSNQCATNGSTTVTVNPLPVTSPIFHD